jgi:hypothetical protein
MFRRCAQNIPLLAALALCAFSCLVIVKAIQEAAQYSAYESSLRDVEISAPMNPPEQDQESIETAMILFSIARPNTMEGPLLDPLLLDRGLTTGGLLLPQKRVTVGSPAFISWGVLGSTLAHEIEIHVDQSFLKVVATDHLTRLSLNARRLVGKFIPSLKPSVRESFESDGTWAAERQAYIHEIRNAQRFGLTPDEIHSIRRVMDYFYPVAKNSEVSQLDVTKHPKTNELSGEDINSLEL